MEQQVEPIVTHHPAYVHMGTVALGRLYIRATYICDAGEVTIFTPDVCVSWSAEGEVFRNMRAENLSPAALDALWKLGTTDGDGVFESVGVVSCYRAPDGTIHYEWVGERVHQEYARGCKVVSHIERGVWFDVKDAQIKELASKVQFCGGKLKKRTLAKCNEAHAKKLGLKL